MLFEYPFGYCLRPDAEVGRVEVTLAVVVSQGCLRANRFDSRIFCGDVPRTKFCMSWSMLLLLLLWILSLGAWIGMQWLPHFHPSMGSNVWENVEFALYFPCHNPIYTRSGQVDAIALDNDAARWLAQPFLPPPKPAIRAFLQLRHRHPKRLVTNMTKKKHVGPEDINFNRHTTDINARNKPKHERKHSKYVSLFCKIAPAIRFVLPPLRNIRSIVGRKNVETQSCLHVSLNTKMSQSHCKVLCENHGTVIQRGWFETLCFSVQSQQCMIAIIRWSSSQWFAHPWCKLFAIMRRVIPQSFFHLSHEVREWLPRDQW